MDETDRMPASLLRFTTFALLMSSALATSATDDVPASGSEACDAGLPADADADSRRIACTIPDEYREDVALAEFFGKALRRHDMAAWLSTDALNKRGALAKAGKRASNPQGWITEEHEQGVRVRYLAGPNAAPVAFASADLRFEPFGVVDARIHEPNLLASEREKRLLKARALAQAAPGLFTCTEATPNVVMTEFEGADGVPRILVAFMSAWMDGAAPMGGYHLVRVDANATQVIDVFSQTKGCPMAGSRREIGKTAALMVSHITTPTPTLFHVFMSLQYRKPMYVATVDNNLMWKVDEGRISISRSLEGSGAQAGGSAP